ncbi:MAG: hypothetical protein IKW49_00190 [Opitutales bacterium]|nr:hypothetical protein [Opitutales bacterium]
MTLIPVPEMRSKNYVPFGVLTILSVSVLLHGGCLSFEARARVREPFYKTRSIFGFLADNTIDLAAGNVFDETLVPNIVVSSLILPFGLAADTLLFPYDLYLTFSDGTVRREVPEDFFRMD